MQVVPSILEKTPQDWVAQLHRLLPYYQQFQIDIEDGKFVTTKTVQVSELVNYFSANKLSLPNNCSFDFDLMTKDISKQLHSIQEISKLLPVKNIFLHPESTQEFLKLQNLFSHFSFGISLNPEDSVETLNKNYNLKNLPIIQIMSIHPGPQGQSFMPNMMKKVEQLRELDYRNKIYLDGGLNDKTIPDILAQKYKPDYVCVGSFLTKAEDVKQRAAYLESLLQTS